MYNLALLPIEAVAIIAATAASPNCRWSATQHDGRWVLKETHQDDPVISVSSSDRVRDYLCQHKVVTLTGFTKKFQRIKKRDRDQLLSELLADGQIAFRKITTAQGRPTVLIRWAEQRD